jgi:hypothetical protein
MNTQTHNNNYIILHTQNIYFTANKVFLKVQVNFPKDLQLDIFRILLQLDCGDDTRVKIH